MKVEQFLTLNEVARRVNYSRLTIRHEITAGRLEAMRTGQRGHFRISEEAYERWLATFHQAA
jgi:excisionase family DNA binding protein